MNGSLLWFNGAKDTGAIVTDDGERVFVAGAAFPEGRAIAGRCNGTRVTFEVADGPDGRSAVAVSVAPTVTTGRARRRRRPF